MSSRFILAVLALCATCVVVGVRAVDHGQQELCKRYVCKDGTLGPGIKSFGPAAGYGSGGVSDSSADYYNSGVGNDGKVHSFRSAPSHCKTLARGTRYWDMRPTGKHHHLQWQIVKVQGPFRICWK